MTITDELRRRGLLDVAEDIARGLHVTVEEVFTVRHCAHGRRSFYAYLRAVDPQTWSYPMIGKLVGRDHSTIIQALRGP